jgi:hypothetical protein
MPKLQFTAFNEKGDQVALVDEQGVITVNSTQSAVHLYNISHSGNHFKDVSLLKYINS